MLCAVSTSFLVKACHESYERGWTGDGAGVAEGNRRTDFLKSAHSRHQIVAVDPKREALIPYENGLWKRSDGPRRLAKPVWDRRLKV
jgi:hypothetical protein